MTTTPQTPNARVKAAESVGTTLLQALLTEIKLLKKPWPAMSQKQQDQLIDRLRRQVSTATADAVHIIASDGRVVVQAELEGVAIKDDIKATFVVSRTNPLEAQQGLFSAHKKTCLLVVASPAEYTGGMDEVKGEPDQRGLDLGQEYTSQDGDGMDEEKILTIEAQPLQSELANAFGDGYQAAQEGKELSDCPLMPGALCIEWVAGWKYWHQENNTEWWQEHGSDENTDATEAA